MYISRPWAVPVSGFIDDVVLWAFVDTLGWKKGLLDAYASTVNDWDVVGGHKTYILTSGVLVTGYHKNEPDRAIDETTPSPPRAPAFQGYADLEKHALTSYTDKLTSIVIRPSAVYGRAGRINVPESYFAQAQQDKLVIKGNPRRLFAQIHVDDLADVYVKAVRAGRRVNGEAFNISSFTPFAVEDVALKASKAAGFKGAVEYREFDPTDLLASSGNRNIIVNPQKAVDVLGWLPRRAPFLDEVEIHYEAWKAAQPHHHHEAKPASKPETDSASK
eukprot:TRINITY_DN2381_c1_g1_i1.p1 TRINITY_DN2381_c1_g1~~TRINITY_DN2381_c1_g1_i1.p1  ORF type:complete len:275 (+),score=41.06 TRINITY_DN2381_c1_g1_i1:286-1110(+)